jgi:hypothetical protein
VIGQVEGRWQLSLRRTGPIPADERDRYASRLRRIVAAHGGRYDTFVPDALEPRLGDFIEERAPA